MLRIKCGIILQAALAAGNFLIIAYCVFLTIGILILVRIFMNLYWKATGKHNNIKSGMPFYKDPVPFFISLIFSILILTGLFYLLIITLFRNYSFD